MCGEYYQSALLFSKRIGSPPRVRGILNMTTGSSMRTGITPACAGNTRRYRQQSSRPQDHPRVCGEYVALHLVNDTQPGSPPRVRGILNCPSGPSIGRRITPACAGNTSLTVTSLKTPRDHPRVCGEYIFASRPRKTQGGSPPRVRGIPLYEPSDDSYGGITPACAGNTFAL